MRDLFARDAGRIAAAGEALVVVQDDLGDRAVALDALDQLGALLRVELDLLPLVVGELAVGEQDAVGQDELADVVQQRGGVDQVLLALVEAEHASRPRASSARRPRNGARSSRRAWTASAGPSTAGPSAARRARACAARAPRRAPRAWTLVRRMYRKMSSTTAASADRADAEVPVGEGDAGGQQAGRELRRQRGDERAQHHARRRRRSRARARRRPARSSACSRHERRAGRPPANHSGSSSCRVGRRARRSSGRRASGNVANVARLTSARSSGRRDRRRRRRARRRTPSATAGAGPSSAMASTSARNEPERRRPADLEAEHLAAEREHEQQPEQRRAAASRRRGS